MLESLKQEVFDANKLLSSYNFLAFPWCNVSGIDRNTGLIVVKPSRPNFDEMSPDDMMVVDLNGTIIEGNFDPPSDLSIHIVLYNSFPNIKGITHSHSRWATTFAQMGMGIPALGTIHADHFHGEIPCTRKLRTFEIRGDYEKEVGTVIAERFLKSKLNPDEIPGVLICNHSPLTWGSSPQNALFNFTVLEEIAFMAWHCMAIPDKYLFPMQKDLLEYHYNKEHNRNTVSEKMDKINPT